MFQIASFPSPLGASSETRESMHRTGACVTELRSKGLRRKLCRSASPTVDVTSSRATLDSPSSRIKTDARRKKQKEVPCFLFFFLKRKREALITRKRRPRLKRYKRQQNTWGLPEEVPGKWGVRGTIPNEKARARRGSTLRRGNNRNVYDARFRNSSNAARCPGGGLAGRRPILDFSRESKRGSL